MPEPVDWEALRDAAAAAAGHAYAPYSGLRVGAAALTDTGEVVAGCNVENASYGLTVCAEPMVVGAARLTGAARLVALSCVAPDRDELLMPCGRCRQVLLEAGGPDLAIDGPDGPLTIGELLPHAFDGSDLP